MKNKDYILAAIAPSCILWNVGTGKKISRKERATLKRVGIDAPCDCIVDANGNAWKNGAMLPLLIVNNYDQLDKGMMAGGFNNVLVRVA